MFKRNKSRKNPDKQNGSREENLTQFQSIPIDTDIKKNKEKIDQIIGNGPNIYKRELKIKTINNKTYSVFLLGIGGLVDEQAIREQVIEPLLSKTLDSDINLIDEIKEEIYLKDLDNETNLYQSILQVIKGSTLLLIDGYKTGVLLNAEGSVERALEEPPTGTVVSGSREGFVEKISTNISLLRKRISHPSLRFRSYIVGEFSQTDIVVSYVEGIVDPKKVQEIHNRIRQIEVDDISSSGQVEQYINDNPYSIFPTTGNTERPDQLAAMLMEGRIAILVDGDPVTLYSPNLFIENLQSTEDYSSKPFYSSFVRILRLFAFVTSILLPAIYISAVNIHKDIIPSSFLLALEQSREGVPFPLVLETIMLLILFEIVREAGVRMPRAIGQAVSIVGALILGEVSVVAGLISPQTIIIVATASITTFIVTPVAEVVSLLRIIYIIPSAFFGFYGLMICFLATITHMVNLKSLDVYYVSPLMPSHVSDWKDAIIRFPYRLLKYRPKSIPNMRPVRYTHVPPLKKNKDDEI